jgi:hypothetical protein
MLREHFTESPMQFWVEARYLSAQLHEISAKVANALPPRYEEWLRTFCPILKYKAQEALQKVFVQ